MSGPFNGLFGGIFGFSDAHAINPVNMDWTLYGDLTAGVGMFRPTLHDLSATAGMPMTVVPAGIEWERAGPRHHRVTIRREPEARFVPPEWQSWTPLALRCIRGQCAADPGVAALEINMSEESKWRPIEEAPLDKTPVLLWCGGSVKVGYFVRLSENWSAWTTGFESDGYNAGYPRLHPTHWLPLPEPPNA